MLNACLQCHGSVVNSLSSSTIHIIRKDNNEAAFEDQEESSGCEGGLHHTGRCTCASVKDAVY